MPLIVILLGLTSFFTDVGTEVIFLLLPVFLTGTLKAAMWTWAGPAPALLLGALLAGRAGALPLCWDRRRILA